jgi:membrane protein implicated in regulation of membrane protease activity
MKVMPTCFFIFSGLTLIFPFAEKLLGWMLFFAFLVLCLSVVLLFGVWLKGVRNRHRRRDFEWARLRQRLKKYAEARMNAKQLRQQKPNL